ncbi:hypothetical protein SAMN00808754_1395 [Thermanaeromonas toyohensis ToBE]|uniref:Uncharacterized protein n=1 Tax=Thermanaeromonas toyohensis ToBE TaxID=698762 RepID=A0A1W1VRT0_9FIRM|nr:hypothetical protein [Thermanaeromonas toyohensis]SMB96069.1 hypothetical protein SAMN00808754_1395 [Thermanaeromonas toyohensis ToBE]
MTQWKDLGPLHPCVTFTQLVTFADEFYDFTASGNASDEAIATASTKKNRRKRAKAREGNKLKSPSLEQGENGKKKESWLEKVGERAEETKEEAKNKIGGHSAKITLREFLPRAADQVVGWCRECGGPVIARDPLLVLARSRREFVGTTKSSVYRSTWADEGCINYKQSLWVCGGCRRFKKESDRSWCNMGRGEALLAEPGRLTKIGLADAIRRLSIGEVDIPFCLVLGNPNGKNPDHYYFGVPVNWSLDGWVMALRSQAGGHAVVQFRPGRVMSVLDALSPEASSKEIKQLCSDAGLFPAEKLVVFLAKTN